MKSFYDVGWWDANGRDEELGTGVYGHCYQVVELAMGVIVVCFAGGAADLGESQVDAEGEAFVGEVCFEVVDNLMGGLAVVHACGWG